MNVKRKIIVFISSKCGGEYLNYESYLHEKKPEEITEIAIRSSYDIVRRGLKLALEETGLFDVYLFEDENASSIPVVENYLSHLDISHLCLFLIDNFDEKISGGLQKEIDRARNTNKKSIFIFLNDSKKPPSEIQKYIQSLGNSQYITINDVRDFISRGYTAIIEEILEIYKLYSKLEPHINPSLSNFDDRDVSLVNLITERTHNKPEPSNEKRFVNIKKEALNDLPCTKKKIANYLLSEIKDDTHETNKLDELLSEVFELLFYRRTISDLQTESLIQILSETQDEKLNNFVKRRWDVIINYFSGDLETAISTIKMLYEENEGSSEIPEWLMLDLLRDWNRLAYIEDQSLSRLSFTVGRKFEDYKSIPFFPLIDKMGYEIEKGILEREFSLKISTPDTISFFSGESYFDWIKNSLFSAVYFGSLTKMFVVVDQIRKVLIHLLNNFDHNHLFVYKLIELTIILEDRVNFSKIMNLYKSTLTHSTDEEVFYLYRLAGLKTISYLQREWKILLFGEIGYYLSNEHYENTYAEVAVIFEEWLQNENHNREIGKLIIEAFRNNSLRLSTKKIVKQLLLIFSIDTEEQYWSDIIKCLLELNYLKVTTNLANELIIILKKIITSDKAKYLRNDIQILFLVLRNQILELSEEIDETVKENFPRFYETEYSFETKHSSIEKLLSEKIEEIQKRNRSQGIGGKITYYGYSPYVIISRILGENKSNIDEKLISDLIEVINQTLLSPNQTFDEKRWCLDTFIQVIKADLFQNFDLLMNFEYLKNNEKLIFQGKGLVLHTNDNIILRLDWCFVKILFGDSCFHEVIELLSELNSYDEAVQIESLRIIENIIIFGKEKLIKENILSAVIQYSTRFCFHESFYLRYYSAILLFLVLDTMYTEFAINLLRKMMLEDEDYRVKLIIIRKSPQIEKYNQIAFEYIVRAGSNDNNFIVQTEAKRILEDMKGNR